MSATSKVSPMRRVLPAVLVAVGLATAATAGLAAVGAAATPADGPGAGPAGPTAGTHGASVTGVVTDADGDAVEGAYVLAQPAFATALESAVNGSRPVGETLLDLARDPPRGVLVNTSRAGGAYLVDLSGQGRYDVVAVAADGSVSAIRTVEVGSNATELDLTVDGDRVLAVDGQDVAGTPGRTTAVSIAVENTDDRPVRNLSVSLGPLPDGWSVEDVTTDGSFDEATRTVRWERVAAGETATATVTLTVPEDAALDTYAIDLTADAATHYVEHVDAVRVRVSPPNSTKTPEATPTPLGGSNIQPAVGTTPTRGGHGIPPLSVGVFALGVAVAAYAVGRTGLPLVGRDAD